MNGPYIDVTQYLQAVLFRLVPHRRRFLIVGAKFIPVQVVASARILLASIGLTAGSTWRQRTLGFLQVTPGFEVMDVVHRRAQSVEESMRAAKSIAWPLRLWLVAGIENEATRPTAWMPRSASSALCGIAFFDGAAWGLVRPDARDVVETWIDGVRGAWSSAVRDGLAVSDTPPAITYASWHSIVDAFLMSYEHAVPIASSDEAVRSTWRDLEQLWRFEVFRLGLVGMGRVDWRDEAATSPHRGIIC